MNCRNFSAHSLTIKLSIMIRSDNDFSKNKEMRFINVVIYIVQHPLDNVWVGVFFFSVVLLVTIPVCYMC